MNEITAQEMIQEMRLHEEVMRLHTKALACHCECLGMNAENVQRMSLGQNIAYSDESYLNCMTKWGLMTEKRRSINLIKEVLK